MRSYCFFTLLLGLLVFSWLRSQSRPRLEAVAVVGSERITYNEMEENAAVYQAAQHLYEVRQEWLNRRIEDALLQREAVRRGVPLSRLLDQEVNQKAIASQQEVGQFCLRNRKAVGADTRKARESATAYLLAQKQSELREELLAQLRARHPIRVNLLAPTPPIFRVNIQDAILSGPADAPVTIVEFTDFQCPYSAHAAGTISKLRDLYGEKLRLAAMNFPLPSHPMAFRAAEAALCAGQQGKYWEYRDLLFAKQKNLRDDLFFLHAKALGFDLGTFGQCLNSPKTGEQVRTQMNEGKQVGVQATPTFLVNGRLLVGDQRLDEFQRVTEEVLQSP